jgi:DNA-binding NarL/FixJ family response regulator
MQKRMDAIILKNKVNTSPSGEGMHILLVGNDQTGKLRRMLEAETGVLVVTEAKNDESLTAIALNGAPDVIIAMTDSITPVETFNITLKTLCRIGMNARTIIISDYPFRYLGYALKAKVAALLYRKIENRDLVHIIHEVRTWSHGQPIPSGISSMDNQPGPETKSGGE